MTASPYLLRTADPIATGQHIPLDVRKGVGGARIELGTLTAIPSGLFAQRLTAVVDTSGVQLMTRTRRHSAEPDPGLTERLVTAISTAVHNGFPVDPTVLKRVLNLARAIEKYVPQILAGKGMRDR